MSTPLTPCLVFHRTGAWCQSFITSSYSRVPPFELSSLQTPLGRVTVDRGDGVSV